MSFNNKYFTSYLIIAHGVVFMEPRQGAKTVMLPGGSVQDTQGLGWLCTLARHILKGGRDDPDFLLKEVTLPQGSDLETVNYNRRGSR